MSYEKSAVQESSIYPPYSESAKSDEKQKKLL
jgi:hypothetical protein